MSRLPRRTLFQVVVAALALLCITLIVYPIAGMIIRELFPGGNFNADAFTGVLDDPDFLVAVRNTIVVLAFSGALSLLIGGAFAWLNEKTDAGFGLLSTLLPLVPLILPPVALSVGWVFLGDLRAGLLNVAIRDILAVSGVILERGPLRIASWPGLVFIYVLYFVPFVFLIVSAAFRNVDPALEEASRISGASMLRTLRSVSFPAIKPAMASAALLIVILGIATFSFAQILGVPGGIPVLSVYLVRQVQSYPAHLDYAVVVGLLVMLVVTTAWWLQSRIARAGNFAVLSGKSGSAALVRLNAWRWVVRAVMLLYLLLSSLLPAGALLFVALQPFWTPSLSLDGLSLDNFRDFLRGSSIAKQALLTSLTLGAVAATVGILMAALLSAYGRSRPLHGRIIDGILKLPGAFSHIVIGVAFLIAFGGSPFFLNGTLLILLMAYVIMNMPQASIASNNALDQIGQGLIDASAIAGAGPGRTFWSISLPLMRSGLAAGWALLFIFTVGDLTASAILSGTTNPVVGFVFLSIYENGTYADLAALGSIVSLITGTVVIAVVWLTKPKFGLTPSG